MMTHRHRAAVALAAALALALLPGCGSKRKQIRVFGADSLSASFQEMKREFEKLHPDTEVVEEFHGSVLLTRLLPQKRADVVALADHRLVCDVLAPQHARWVAQFATTEIVLAYTASSKYQTEINAANWFDILLRPDVTFGTAEPNLDPCGYYTRLTWKLAEKHYFASKGKDRKLHDELAAHCPPERISRDALALISDLLSTNRIDYAFVYKVHSRDLKLPHLPLPKEINLGDFALQPFYASVQAMGPDYHGGSALLAGTAIAYGVTIPNDPPNPEGAEAFLRFLLSEPGRAILRRSDFGIIAPARVPKWCQGAAPDLGPELLAPEQP